MRGKANYLRWLPCVLLVLVAARTAPAGRVIYVDASAAEGNDGSSWKDAFNYLRDALVTASAGDEIRVAEGTYKPNQGLIESYSGPSGGGPLPPGEEGRSATFELNSGVTVKGGFAGFGAADPNERDTEAYQTILSGDLNGDDADVSNPPDFFYEPTRADNSVNVITSIAADASAVLDGFVVTGGVDGGMVIIDGSPTILNCVFRHNSASGGGAINIWTGQSLLRNCKFISNLAGNGGAICGVDANLTLSECSFTGNRALSIGGGMLINGNAVLTGCVFSDNTSQSGGGISHIGGELGLGKLELTSCAFSGNSAISSSSNRSGSGGAVDTYEATANNCIFSGNSAYHGGAISGGVQSIENCIFTGNTAEQGGALRGIQGSTIRNSIFTGNRAEQGGVLYATGHGPSLISCTLSDNSARNGNAVAWGMYSRRPTPMSMTISNCILWNGGDEIYTWEEELLDISIVYSDIQGGWPGEGNIDLDPCFAEPGYWEPDRTPADANDDVWVDGDYHLKSQVGRWDPVRGSWVNDDVTSPCIDAGDPTAPVASEPFPNGGIINMGVYGGTAEASKSCFGERVGENNIYGDINSDCKVDLVDLLTVIAQWTNGVPPILEERPLLVVDQPLDGARLEISLEPILIRAGVYDPDNSIKNVSINVYRDGASWNTRRGAIRKEPGIWPVEYLEWEWEYNGQNQMGPGQYTIIVEAVDDKDNTIISPEIKVTLLEQPESMVAE